VLPLLYALIVVFFPFWQKRLLDAQGEGGTGKGDDVVEEAREVKAMSHKEDVRDRCCLLNFDLRACLSCSGRGCEGSEGMLTRVAARGW